MAQIISIEKQVERLTDGPKHHLFGFHDLKISNQLGDKYLALEVETMNRPPLPCELFGVGYVKNGQFVKVGETTALNYPQGARQQWVAETECFTVNNRVGDVWGCDLYDATTNRLLDRYEATAHMLSPDGKYAYGIDYARLHRLGGYGYTGLADVSSDEPAPADRGITKLNLKTKSIELLVSVRQVAECGTDGKIAGVSHHYLTHLCVSPSGKRIAFLHRYFFADGGQMTRLMTIGVDGSRLRCLAQGFLSHFDWQDDEHIFIYGRANSGLDAMRNNKLLSNPVMSALLKTAKKTVKFVLHKKTLSAPMPFLLISDSETPVIAPIGLGILTTDGHPMTNPVNRDWCVNDTYPDAEGYRDLMLFNYETQNRVNLGRFKRLFADPDMALKEEFLTGMDRKVLGTVSEELIAFTRSGLHCDLHPRWSADGKWAVFDSIHEGTRQIYRVNVEDVVLA